MQSFTACLVRHSLTAILLALLITSAAHAQLGTITGQILCDDTQKPARFASVELLEALPSGKSLLDNPAYTIKTCCGEYHAHTLADGSFVISDVPVGTYKIKIRYPGYIDPTPFFFVPKLDQSRIPSLMNLYTQVTVQAGRSVNATATLYRGAELGGTVTYDDGTPVEGFKVIPLLANVASGISDGSAPDIKNANLSPIESLSSQLTTDAHGRFHFGGLIEGTYSVLVVPQEDKDLFPVYLGNTANQSKATLVTVKVGEERSDLEIEIDLNKYHQVRGVLTDISHRPLPKNGIALGFRNSTDYPARPYAKTADDGSFSFSYVPDGDYSLFAGGTRLTAVTVSGQDINDLVVIAKP